MKRIKNIILSIALVVLVGIVILPTNISAVENRSASHYHPACGSVCSCQSRHYSENWTPLSSDSLRLYSGNYYLEADMTLYDLDSIRICGNVTICLNGHTIRKYGTSSVILVESGTFMLTDCGTTGLMTVGTNNDNSFSGTGTITIMNSANFIMYGGTVECLGIGDGLYFSTTGNAEIYGGKIRSYTGSGIDISKVGNLTIYNCEICSSDYFGFSCADRNTLGSFGNINIMDGTISGKNGGMYFGQFTCTGEICISGGTFNGVGPVPNTTTWSSDYYGLSFANSGASACNVTVVGGTFKGARGGLYSNNPNLRLVIKGGEFVRNRSVGIVLSQANSIFIQGGKIYSLNCSSSTEIDITDGEILSMNLYDSSGEFQIDIYGGTIGRIGNEIANNAINAQTMATIRMYGGTVEGKSYAFDFFGYSQNSGIFDLLISGGTISGGACDIRISKAATTLSEAYISLSGYSGKALSVDIYGSFAYDGLYLAKNVSHDGLLTTSSSDYELKYDAQNQTVGIVKRCKHTNCTINNKADATCTNEGYTGDTYCTDCQTVIEKGTTIPKLNHTYYEVTTEPTCTAKGYTTYTCTACGYRYVADQVNALDHAWGAGIVTNKPTASAVGTRTYFCTVCGASKTEDIPKLLGAGTCGENLTWTLDIEGTLTISGTGAMYDYDTTTKPWDSSHSPIKKVVIGNSVTSIGDYAFYSCDSLTSVTIGNSVTSIGEGAFSGFTSLTSVTIPDSVTSIGDYAFWTCPDLTSVTIGNGVTVIGESTFAWCVSLFEVHMGNSITTIVGDAFLGCESLTTVSIPDSVTTIDGYPFAYCTNLTYNVYDNARYLGNEKNPYLVLMNASSRTITSCQIHEDTKIIADGAFESCTNLTNLIIPNSVQTIGYGNFIDCFDLSVTYCGTELQWNSITIATGNAMLTDMSRNYHSYTDYEITKEPTPLETGIKTYYCSICEQSIIEEIPVLKGTFEDETLVFRNSGALNLEAFVGAQFSVSKEVGDKYQRVYIVITHNGKQQTLDLEYNGAIYYAQYGIAAKQMVDELSIQLYAQTADVTYVGQSYNGWSVKGKALEMLMNYYDWYSYSPAYSKRCDLAAALLNYGAKAQQIFSYRLDNLATDGVPDAYLDLLPKTAATLEVMPKFNEADYQAKLYNPAFILDDVIKASLTFAMGDTKIENYKARVTINGVTEDYTLSQYKLNGTAYPGYAYIIIDSIVAADLRQDFSVTIMKGETAVSTTYTFSMENMAGKLVTSRPEMINAMMHYSDAAYALFREK